MPLGTGIRKGNLSKEARKTRKLSHTICHHGTVHVQFSVDARGDRSDSRVAFDDRRTLVGAFDRTGTQYVLQSAFP